MARRTTVDLITLGCSKNLVDSERLIHQLESAGYRVTHDADRPHGQIAVINTCGFIAAAKEESINTILQFVQAKEQAGRPRKVYVMGCLTERYMAELQAEITGVDKFYGKFNWKELLADLGHAPATEPIDADERTLTTPAHYAYLKISEGCNRHCSYCAIPLMTGPHVSRPMDDIVTEVRRLVARGVREFQVIAQELTSYGRDRSGDSSLLPALIERIADVPGVDWLRLHYAYPADFPMDLLRVMRERPNVCRYLDIAFQHISDHMLQLMRRHVTQTQTYDLIAAMRREVPGLHLRTTLMVGHPGETEADFDELCEFVRRARFDRMGAFTYSEEEGTYAARHYTDDIAPEVKQRRLDTLMAIQQQISAELGAQKVGTQLRVIVDRQEGDYYVARTEFDSPEVDPEVLIPVSEGPLRTGQFYNVQITDGDDYDLFARLVP